MLKVIFIFCFVVSTISAQSWKDALNKFANDAQKNDSLTALKQLEEVRKIYGVIPSVPVVTDLLKSLEKFSGLDTIKKYFAAFNDLRERVKKFHLRNNYDLRQNNYIVIDLKNFNATEKNIVTAIACRSGFAAAGNAYVINTMLAQCERDKSPIRNFYNDTFTLPPVTDRTLKEAEKYKQHFYTAEKLKHLNETPYLYIE